MMKMIMYTSILNETLVLLVLEIIITVFLRLKDGVFSFQNNPKDLDPSCKMDLDLWDCTGKVKLVLQQNFIGLI